MGKPRSKSKAFGAKKAPEERVRKYNPFDLVFKKSKVYIIFFILI